jgi:hypothetical protein
MNSLLKVVCRSSGAVSFIIAASLWSATIAHPAQQPSDRLLIKRATDSYYNLRRLGLIEFRAAIKPNWSVVLADEIKNDPAGAERVLKMLSGLHFAMLLDQKDSVYVTHSSELSPGNDKLSTAFTDIYSGMDQMVHGFFDTWSLFSLTSVFPPSTSEFQLKDIGSEYELNYQEGSTAVQTIFAKDFITRSIKISGPGISGSVRPVLSKTPKGIVLTGYDGVYESGDHNKAVLRVEIGRQEVSGLELPRTLKISGTLNGQSFKTELFFTDYEVKLR